MRQMIERALVVVMAVLASGPGAAHAGEPTTCAPDAVAVGPACVDRYEASVWLITPAQADLIAKVRAGTATAAELRAGGSQRGLVENDLDADCPPSGNGCLNVFAASVAGVLPSAFVTWFQAVALARNSGKRLLSNVEWQAAALGTPESTSPEALDCNTANETVVPTGSRQSCRSDVGAFDMVGNLYEWVSDWLPISTACVPPVLGNGINCLAGAGGGPGAIMRGGSYYAGESGVFAVYAALPPTGASDGLGFRAAR